MAVAGAASAQVTLSGEAGFAYISDKNITAASAATNGVAKAQATKQGLAQTDGSITISASEDLGGGLKAMVAHTVDLKGRSSVSAENSSMSVSGAFGTVMVGAVEAGNGILGLGSAGGVGRGLDNGVALDGGTNVDLLQYTTPELVPGLTALINTAEITPGAGDGVFQGTTVGLNYSAGPLTVAFDNTSYSGHAAAKAVTARKATCTNVTSGLVTDPVDYGTACAAGAVMLTPGVKAATVAQVLATQIDSRQRLSVSYDLGMAKVGFGTQTKKYAGTGVDNKQTVMGVSVPFGAITVSLAKSSQKDQGSATKVTGTDIGVNYAMSKRTSLNLSSMSTKETGSASNTFTRLRLKHTF